MQRATDAAYFWSLVKRNGPDECWEWQGGKDKDGYGKVSVKDVQTRAHRFAYQLEKGPILKGLCVCHSCDNPPCCNPNHLWLGTNTQNSEDSKSKGRKKLFALRGSRHHNAFLTEEDVVRLRQLRSRGWRVTDLANIFCVSKQLVSDATLGRKWAHLEMLPFARKAIRNDARA